jgi:hypothetical protein
MSGKAFGILPPLLLATAAAGLTALGLHFRTTDVAAMAKAGGSEAVIIPVFPGPSQPQTESTDAFTRPMFHRDRAPGPDKAPVSPVSADPDAPNATGETSEAPVLKGLIIGELGARVALKSSDAAAPVWVKVGEAVGGWTVEVITSKGVRIRSGDEVVDVKFSDDQ